MNRVLLVRLSAMGDVVQALGAVRALAERRPDLELCFVTQTEHVPLLERVPGLAAVVAHERRGGARAWLRTRAALRALGCETALDLQGNAKSAAIARLSGARRRIGAAGPWRQEPWSRLLLTECVPVPGPRHPALVAAALVARLAPAARLGRPRLSATAAEIAAAAARVRASGIDPARPFRVFVGGAPSDPRSLQPAQVVAEAAGGGAPALLLLGPAEAAVPAPSGLAVLRQARGQLRELVGIGALLAQVGGQAIGGDQGPVHVLAAAGAHTRVLYGPQDPAATAPPGARVLQHPAPPPCMPCRSRRCRHPRGPVCMEFPSAAGRELPAPDWLAR